MLKREDRNYIKLFDDNIVFFTLYLLYLISPYSKVARSFPLNSFQ